jgi:hypothetical protein
MKSSYMLENNYLKMACNMKPFWGQWKRKTWVQVKLDRQRSGDSEGTVRNQQGKGTGEVQGTAAAGTAAL